MITKDILVNLKTVDRMLTLLLIIVKYIFTTGLECYLKFISRNDVGNKIRLGCVIDKNMKLDIRINNFDRNQSLERLDGLQIIGKILRQDNSYIFEIDSSEYIKRTEKQISEEEDADIVVSPHPPYKVCSSLYYSF